jgi:hypothetical protein
MNWWTFERFRIIIRLKYNTMTISRSGIGNTRAISNTRWGPKVAGNHIHWLLLLNITISGGCSRPSTYIRSRPRAFPGIVSRRKSHFFATGIVIYAPFGISGIPSRFSPGPIGMIALYLEIGSTHQCKSPPDQSGGWLQPFSAISRPFRVSGCFIVRT